jgi:hypothetical protein
MSFETAMQLLMQKKNVITTGYWLATAVRIDGTLFASGSSETTGQRLI